MSLSVVPDRWTLYTAGHVCDVVGITYRQLGYWMELGLVVPSVPGEGKGQVSRFDADDIEWIGVIGDLVRLGIQPAHLRDVLRGRRRSEYVGQMTDAIRRFRDATPLTA